MGEVIRFPTPPPAAEAPYRTAIVIESAEFILAATTGTQLNQALRTAAMRWPDATSEELRGAYSVAASRLDSRLSSARFWRDWPHVETVLRGRP